jgi:hypothetical protein
MEKHQSFFNLVDAFKEGCPICFLVKKGGNKFMDDLLYENVNDPGVREHIRRSAGFCNKHAWQMHKIGDGFGLGIIYEDLLRIVLEKAPVRDDSSASIKKELFDVRGIQSKCSCIVCDQEKTIEKQYCSLFIKSLNDPEFLAQYRNAVSGLCFPHIFSILKESGADETQRTIVQIEMDKAHTLLDELRVFVKKHDYRFEKEGFGSEGNSWIRAIEKLAGKEGIPS